MLYNDKENNVQTTLYRKRTDEQQFYLRVESGHPSALKVVSYTIKC